MTEDELARRLREAFDAQAHAAVGDRAAPPPRYLSAPSRRHGRLLAPLAAAAVVVAVVGAMLFVQNSTGHHRPHPVAGRPHPTTATATATPSGTADATVAPHPVLMRMLTADGQTYGVGMPVIAFFSRRFRSAAPLSAATSVTVDGKPVRAAWYFERSSDARSYPIEGHLRMQTFWPAHARIHVAIAANALTRAAAVDFDTGAQTVAYVTDAKHHLTVSSDGKWLGSFPVSLGAPNTPTSRGTKVIMEKGVSICMRGPGYNECGIKDTQRLTYGGEYLHAAPWNTYNIAHGIDTSNGCTNLLPADAALLYKVLKVGDVVEYPDASGPAMTMGAGFGDWNVPWRVWQQGGLIPSS